MHFFWLLHNGHWSMRCVVFEPGPFWSGEMVCSNAAMKVLVDGH